MSVSFDIFYDDVNDTLEVFQNGSAVGIYSLFSRCNNQPFEYWFANIPQYCSDEAMSMTLTAIP